MTSRLIFFALFICGTYYSFGQNTFDKEFQQDVVEKTWHWEDSATLGYESMIFNLSQDSVFSFYMNWTDGMSISQCSYTSKELNNCFELTTSSCLYGEGNQFVYGYLSEDKQTLYLFFADQRIVDIDKIREKEGWLPFELLTE